MEAVAYTLKSLGLVADINEYRAVSLCGLVVRALDWQLRGVGFDPVSLCGLVVRALDWQLRGVGFDPHQGL